MPHSQNGSLAVRPATPADLPAFKAMIAAAELFPPSLLDDMIAPYFAAADEGIWFTLDEGEPVGMAYCVPERMTSGTWNLLLIAVAPGRQRSGGGRLLLGAVEEHVAKQRGATLLVETSDLPDFSGPRDFYLAQGFVEEARIRDFYQPGEAKVVFWKSLRR